MHIRQPPHPERPTGRRCQHWETYLLLRDAADSIFDARIPRRSPIKRRQFRQHQVWQSENRAKPDVKDKYHPSHRVAVMDGARSSRIRAGDANRHLIRRVPIR